MKRGKFTELSLNLFGMIYNGFIFYTNISIFLNSLTHAHDGQYLAEVTANCLKRFQLDKFVSQFLKKNHVLISRLYCSFWDSVWIMQVTVTAWQNFSQTLYHTSGVMMLAFVVCVILLISLPKFVMFTGNLGSF